MKKKRKVTISLNLPAKDVDKLRRVAKRASTDLNTVINVILALAVVCEPVAAGAKMNTEGVDE